MRLAAAALLLLTAGCASPLYDWGRYEESVLAMETGFQDVDLLDEIDALERQAERAVAKDKRPPPGLHAHLGYLHYLAGNSDAALRHFQAEKAVYPQSTVFMDGLISRL